jgi:glycosyltransferase involved in cell wall biosynthesis
VVIAVYNGERFLARAIQSVWAQTYDAIQLVVVDDGSTDSTVVVARAGAPDVFVALERNSGVSTARNVGTAVAKGGVITYLDADDELLPDKVALQVERLAAAPPCDCVLTHQQVVLDEAAAPPRWLEMDMENLDKPTKLPISAMVRVSSLLLSGGFDPAFRTAEEMDLLMRLTRSGAALDTLPDVAVLRHIHGANVTYDLEQMDRDIVRAIAPMTKRRLGPLVSVIVPVHNGAAYLADALGSVRGQHHIDQSDIELIVVDDGSSDASAELVTQIEPAATVVRQPNLGPGAARNHGILLSRGRTIAFLDADDIWPSNRLRVLLDVCESGVEAAFGAGEEFVSPEATPAERERHRPRAALPARMATAMLIRREALARVGPFPTDPTQPEAAVWYAAAVDAGVTMADTSQVVLRRRLHSTNHSRVAGMATESYPAALKAILDRRRGSTT